MSARVKASESINALPSEDTVNVNDRNAKNTTNTTIKTNRDINNVTHRRNSMDNNNSATPRINTSPGDASPQDSKSNAIHVNNNNNNNNDTDSPGSGSPSFRLPSASSSFAEHSSHEQQHQRRFSAPTPPTTAAVAKQRRAMSISGPAESAFQNAASATQPPLSTRHLFPLSPSVSGSLKGGATAEASSGAPSTDPPRQQVSDGNKRTRRVRKSSSSSATATAALPVIQKSGSQSTSPSSDSFATDPTSAGETAARDENLTPPRHLSGVSERHHAKLTPAAMAALNSGSGSGRTRGPGGSVSSATRPSQAPTSTSSANNTPSLSPDSFHSMPRVKASLPPQLSESALHLPEVVPHGQRSTIPRVVPPTPAGIPKGQSEKADDTQEPAAEGATSARKEKDLVLKYKPGRTVNSTRRNSDPVTTPIKENGPVATAAGLADTANSVGLTPSPPPKKRATAPTTTKPIQMATFVLEDARDDPAMGDFVSFSPLAGKSDNKYTPHKRSSTLTVKSASAHASTTNLSSMRDVTSISDEATALSAFLSETELNLSMSTFTNLGAALSASTALRVLNLHGSTMDSEGMRGLGGIPTLQTLCVSYMKNLTSLVPLITPANRRVACNIQEIDAQCTSLTDAGLLGLERLRQLRRLDLSMTAITNVSHLASSLSLAELHISVTNVTTQGIAGLERMASLRLLNISRSRVTSLVSLSTSPSIETLLLYSCKVYDVDIRGVPQMPRLKHIDLSTTKVSDISVFRTSKALESIKAQWLPLKNSGDLIQQRRAAYQQRVLAPYLSGNNWREHEAGFSGLAEIPTLHTIDLSFNTVRSVHSLCSSKSLKHLYLHRTRADSPAISGLHKLAATLETLVVTNLADTMDIASEEKLSYAGGGTTSPNMLSDITVIAQLTRLTRLDLSFTDVYDLRGLQALPQLKELIIVETLVTVDGLRGIEKIPTLELLDMSQTSILSLQFLTGGAPALKTIRVKSNRNLRGFRLGRIDMLPKLESLDVSDTVVEDIRTMWKPSWALKELIWRWGERREAAGAVPSMPCWVAADRLQGISALRSLEVLDLTNSVIDTLGFLNGLKRMKTLTLDGCKLLKDDDVRAVQSLAETLEVLDVSNCPRITALNCLSACKSLRELRFVRSGVTMSGMDGVWPLPSLRVVDITNSKLEEMMIEEEETSRENSSCAVSAARFESAEAAAVDNSALLLPNPSRSIFTHRPVNTTGTASSARGLPPSRRPSLSPMRGASVSASSAAAAVCNMQAPSGFEAVDGVRPAPVPVQYRVRRRRRVSFLGSGPSSPCPTEALKQ